MAKRGRKPGPQKRLPQTFKPGQSGNPGGRPAGLSEFRELCRENAEWAMEALKKALKKAAAKGNVLGVAAGVKLIWESGFGKPAVSVRLAGEDGGPVQADVKHTHEFRRPSPEQLAPIVDALARSGVLPRVIGAGAARPGADAQVEPVPGAGGGGGEPEGGDGGSVPVADADGVPPAGPG
jgi:hypothetical protein